jgi:hypothetical protein
MSFLSWLKGQPSLEDQVTRAYHAWADYSARPNADQDTQGQLFAEYETLSAQQQERLG